MKTLRIDYLLDATSVSFLTYASVVETAKAIYWALAGLASLLSLAFTIYTWYKKAKSDGQITKDELKEGAKIVIDHFENKRKDNDRKEK